MRWLKSTSRLNASSPYRCLTTRGLFLALLWRMTPSVDSVEILPVGGRLKISNLSWNDRNPVVSYHRRNVASKNSSSPTSTIKVILTSE